MLFPRLGSDHTGQPGLQVYAADGDLQWHHETETPVLDVGINAEQGLVVAGIDLGRPWHVPSVGGALAPRRSTGDGRTVRRRLAHHHDAASGGPRRQRLDPLWESDVTDANPSVNPVLVSEDGSRVAVSTFAFEVVILEEGEPLWADTNEAGPYYTGLAADGLTPATLAVDTDARTAAVAGYRL